MVQSQIYTRAKKWLTINCTSWNMPLYENRTRDLELSEYVVYLAHAQDNYPKRAILRARADSQTWAYIPVEMSYGHIRHHSLPSILAPLTSLVSKPLGKIRVTRARYVKPGNIGVECQELLPGAA